MTTHNNHATALMVVGHGTTSADGIRQFTEVVEQLRTRVDVPVGHGFLELAEPDINSGISKLLAKHDCSDVIVLPLLLLAAGHVKNDVPASLLEARKNFGEVNFKYARDLSITPTLLEIVEDRSHSPFEFVHGHKRPKRKRKFTLLVGRGSTDLDANSDLYKIARLLTERGALGEVEPAFISLAPPNVTDALDKLELLGATEITIAPYFLFAGTLLQRIYSQSREWQIHNPDITLGLAKEMGPDPRIVDLLIQRSTEIQLPLKLTNCDMCIYRSEIPGHPLPLAPAGGHPHRH